MAPVTRAARTRLGAVLVGQPPPGPSTGDAPYSNLPTRRTNIDYAPDYPVKAAADVNAEVNYWAAYLDRWAEFRRDDALDIDVDYPKPLKIPELEAYGLGGTTTVGNPEKDNDQEGICSNGPLPIESTEAVRLKITRDPGYGILIGFMRPGTQNANPEEWSTLFAKFTSRKKKYGKKNLHRKKPYPHRKARISIEFFVSRYNYAHVRSENEDLWDDPDMDHISFGDGPQLLEGLEYAVPTWQFAEYDPALMNYNESPGKFTSYDKVVSLVWDAMTRYKKFNGGVGLGVAHADANMRHLNDIRTAGIGAMSVHPALIVPPPAPAPPPS